MTGKPKATKAFFASSKQPKRQEVLTAAVIAATFIIVDSFPSMSQLSIGDISALICAGTGINSNFYLQTLDAIPLGNVLNLP